MWYRITEDPYGKPCEGGGNFPEYIEIEIMSIKEFGWDSDITKARFGVEKGVSHGPDRNIVGRDMKTNKTIHNENGLVGDIYDYINVSQGPIDKMISFFITEYVKKYPQLKGKKYLNANEIFKIDNNLFQKSLKYHDEEREKSISEYEMERKNIEMEIESKYLYTTEEIEEYLWDLKDYISENFSISEIRTNMGIIKDGNVWIKGKYGTKSWVPQKDTPNSQVAKSDYSKEKLFYISEFLIDKLSISDGEDEIKIRENLSKIISKVEELITLPNDLKLFKFGIAEKSNDPFIGRFGMFFTLRDYYTLVIAIEQI